MTTLDEIIDNANLDIPANDRKVLGRKIAETIREQNPKWRPKKKKITKKDHKGRIYKCKVIDYSPKHLSVVQKILIDHLTA